MLEATATVISVDRDWVLVQADRPAGCGACSDGGPCVGASCVRGRGVLRVLNAVGAAAGDRVVIGVSDGTLFHAVAAAYLLPLATALTGGALGVYAAPAHADAVGALGFLAGLGAGVLALRGIRSFGPSSVRCRAVALRRLGADR